MTLLKDLTPEELGALYERNTWLKKEIEKAREEANYYRLEEIADRLREAKHTDFSIGGGYGDFIRVKAGYFKEFLDVLQGMQTDFYIVGDDLNTILNRLTDKAGFFDDCHNCYIDISDENYTRLERWFSANIKEINEYILEYCYEITTDFDDIEMDLELFQINEGENYETDGTFIFEVNARKYA